MKTNLEFSNVVNGPRWIRLDKHLGSGRVNEWDMGECASKQVNLRKSGEFPLSNGSNHSHRPCACAGSGFLMKQKHISHAWCNAWAPSWLERKACFMVPTLHISALVSLFVCVLLLYPVLDLSSLMELNAFFSSRLTFTCSSGLSFNA